MTKKLYEYNVDESFEICLLIKSADVRMAKMAIRLSPSRSKINPVKWTENIGLPRQMILQNTYQEKW